MTNRKSKLTFYLIIGSLAMITLISFRYYISQSNSYKYRAYGRHHFYEDIRDETKSLHNAYDSISFKNNSFILYQLHPINHQPYETDSFDLILFVGPAIQNMVHMTIEKALKNVIGYRRVIVISPILYHNLTISAYKHNFVVEWISDDFINTKLKEMYDYKFEKDQYRFTEKWRHQQIMKLYAMLVIPNVLPRILIMDGEVLWLKPTTFLTNGTTALLNRGYEKVDKMNPFYHRFLEIIYPPIHKHLKETVEETFISHHILLQRDILLSMMKDIEILHNRPFWHVFIHSGKCSEYELYGRYSRYKFPHRTIVRDLDYVDTAVCTCRHPNLSYISCHHHLQEHALQQKEKKKKKKKELFSMEMLFSSTIQDDCIRYRGHRIED